MFVHTCACFAFNNDAGHLIINTHAPLAVSRLSLTQSKAHTVLQVILKSETFIYGQMFYYPSCMVLCKAWTSGMHYEQHRPHSQFRQRLCPTRCTWKWRSEALLPAQTLGRSSLLWILKINCSQVAYSPIMYSGEFPVLQKYRFFYLCWYCTNGTQRTRAHFSWICYKPAVKVTPRSQTSPWESPLTIWFKKRYNN